MITSCKFALLIPAFAFNLLSVVYAASPVAKQQPQQLGNSYYMYTKSLEVSESGVAPLPQRYKWSVETSWRGIDVNGNDHPDSRVMLRLYDPEQNFTALTAQMDLATAAKLQQELAKIITKKLQNPTFQHRPQLYDSKDIPQMKVVGVDEDGVAIMEVEEANLPPLSKGKAKLSKGDILTVTFSEKEAFLLRGERPEKQLGTLETPLHRMAAKVTKVRPNGVSEIESHQTTRVDDVIREVSLTGLVQSKSVSDKRTVSIDEVANLDVNVLEIKPSK